MLSFCRVFRVDPAEYFLETDPEKQVVRDAAATVMYDQVRREQQAQKNQ